MSWQSGDIVGPTNLNNKGLGASSTYNAGNYARGTTGVTADDNATAVNSAVAAAVAASIKYVFVPHDLLPYTASKVTFNTAVRMVREGGDPSVYEPEAYGADHTGATDATTEINTALTQASLAGSNSGTPFRVVCSGKYLVSSDILLQPGVILTGLGTQAHGGSEIVVASGYTGTAVIRNPAPTQFAAVEDLSITCGNIAGTCGIQFDSVGQLSRIKRVVVNQPTLDGIRVIDSAQNQNGLSIEDVWVFGSGASGVSAMAGYGINVTNHVQFLTIRNVHLEYMASTYGAINIDGTLGATSSIMIDGVHFETAGTNHAMNIVNVKHADNVCVQNVYVIGSDNTDTVVTFGTATVNCSARNIRAGSAGETILADTPSSVTMIGKGSGLNEALQQYTQLGANSGRTHTIFGDRDLVSADRGDTTIGLTPGVDAPIQIFNTPFTATRQVTFAAFAQCPAGSFFQIVRTPSATGLFSLQVQDAASTLIKFMGPGQWMSVRSDGSAWHITGFGYVLGASPTVVLTDAATIATEAPLSTSYEVTLGGNRTMGAPTHPVNGQRITHTIVQDGTGGRTLAWNAVFKNSWSDTGNTLGKRSTISHIYDGTNWNQDGAQSPYV